MASDSSSDEDEYDKFKEAVDAKFLTDSLYSNDNAKVNSKNPSKLPPSLRNKSNQPEGFQNPFCVRVTPEFQKHVSDHLSRILEKIIDDKSNVFKRKEYKSSNLKSGIRLLSSSKDYLSASSFQKPARLKKHLNKQNLDSRNYNFYYKRAKKTAVSSEWVLSKKETLSWAPNTKGVVEIVRVDNLITGNLMCNKN